MRALSSTLLRTLDLAQPTATAGRRFLSAASGMARVDNRFYIVADDELEIFWCEMAGKDPVMALPAFGGILPSDVLARKKQKPDLESLVALPRGTAGSSRQALLAMPSGSSEQRMKAVLIEPLGGLDHSVVPVDCAPLMKSLCQGPLPGLNIEGALVMGEHFILLHRGGKTGANALIKLPARAVLERLAKPVPVLDADLPYELTRVELGALAGVPLGFTDAAALTEDRFIFAAAAEATENAYDDGAISGSVIGFAALDGAVSEVFSLEAGLKIEGIYAELTGPSGADVAIRMVTDADDPTRPSELRAATIPHRPSRRAPRALR